MFVLQYYDYSKTMSDMPFEPELLNFQQRDLVRAADLLFPD